MFLLIATFVCHNLEGEYYMPLKEYYYTDEVLGRVLIKHSARAHYINLKIRSGEVILTLPEGVDESKGLAFLRSKYDWIREHLSMAKANKEKLVFDENVQFSTLTFELKILRGLSSDFQFKLASNLLTIICPNNVNLRSQSSQDIIRMGIEKVLRVEAKRVLPSRLRALAQQHGFSYQQVTIRSSQSRWGSCSTSGNINLSYFLLTLPPHLVDYVLLHELCHTKEMNHGPAFWALMKKVTNGKSDVWKKEIKQYHTSF